MEISRLRYAEMQLLDMVPRVWARLKAHKVAGVWLKSEKTPGRSRDLFYSPNR